MTFMGPAGSAFSDDDQPWDATMKRNLDYYLATADPADDMLRPTRIHVGRAIGDWMRSLARDNDPEPGATYTVNANRLASVPVVLDDSLPSGVWSVRNRLGREMKSGRVGRPGEAVFFDAEARVFYAMSPDAAFDLGMPPT